MIYRMWDERSQVNGFKGFADLTSFTLKHQVAFGVSELQRIAHVMNVSTSFCFFSEGKNIHGCTDWNGGDWTSLFDVEELG